MPSSSKRESHSVMTKQQFLNRTLACDTSAQQRLLSAAYKSENDVEIERALLLVTAVRRMESSGVFDLLEAFPEEDETG